MSGHVRGDESSAESQAVLKAEQALDEALLKADMAALESLLAPGATRTGPSGTMSTRSEWLEEIKGAVRTTGHRYLSIEREAQQVRLYGETAVVTGLVHIRGSGATSTGQLNTNRYLRAYVRRQGVGSLSRIKQPGSHPPEVATSSRFAHLEEGIRRAVRVPVA